MRVKFDIPFDPEAVFTEEYLLGAKAVTRAMRMAQQDLKEGWRSQIRKMGTGDRLAKTVRGVSFPAGSAVSMGAASVVWTKAPEIVSAHNSGALIQSSDGFYLAIPTPAAGLGRWGRKMTPLTWERRNNLPLRFVYRKGKPSLLVADHARIDSKQRARRKGGRRRKTDGILSGEQTVPIFILVPQVRLRKRYDLDQETRRVFGTISGRIRAYWGD
jgi:hypothetical protein